MGRVEGRDRKAGNVPNKDNLARSLDITSVGTHFLIYYRRSSSLQSGCGIVWTWTWGRVQHSHDLWGQRSSCMRRGWVCGADRPELVLGRV